METFLSFLTSDPVLYGLLLTFITKSVVNVFKLGIMYRGSIPTKDDLEYFKKEVRVDLQYYKKEIKENIMSTVEKIMDEKTKELDSCVEAKDSMVELKAELMVSIKESGNINERLNSIEKQVSTLGSRLYRRDADVQESTRRKSDIE